MPALEDYYEGNPVEPGAFQPLVDAIDGLSDKLVRVLWRRNFGTKYDGSKDTSNGDSVHIVALTHAASQTVKAGAQDLEYTITFPVNFSKPPTIVISPVAAQPIMHSISKMGPDSVVLNLRVPGTTDVTLNGIAYIAIGPVAQPGA